MEQVRIESVEVVQMEEYSAGSKDAGEAVVAAAADDNVPDAAVDESVLQVTQIEVEFATAITAPMDSDP